MHLWDGGDVKTRNSSFLKRVLLVQDLLIHLCHNLLIHHLLLIFHTLLQTLRDTKRDRRWLCELVLFTVKQLQAKHKKLLLISFCSLFGNWTALQKNVNNWNKLNMFSFNLPLFLHAGSVWAQWHYVICRSAEPLSVSLSTHAWELQKQKHNENVNEKQQDCGIK